LKLRETPNLRRFRQCNDGERKLHSNKVANLQQVGVNEVREVKTTDNAALRRES